VPITTVKFLPGVNVEATAVLGEAQIVGSQLIRWKQAGPDIVPEKLGGWSLYYPLSMGSPIRDLHAWEGVNADSHLGVGCTLSLNVITDGAAQTITPRTYLSDTPPSFTTTAGSDIVTIDDPNFTASIYDSIYLLTPVSIDGLVLQGSYRVATVADADTYTIIAAGNAVAGVTAGGDVPEFDTTLDSPVVEVTLADHGYSVGETFNIPEETATTVGGLVLSGAYLVQTVVDADTFTINATSAATSTANGDMNGGDVAIRYYVGIGPSVPSAGYGTSGYGDGGYGIGVSPTPDSGSAITTTNWTLDNWGTVFLACPTDGAIYEFSFNSGLLNATRIIGAPEINGGIFVSQPAQILVAYASSQGGVQDPLTINWSDAGDYTNWTVSSQTQAGGYRLPTGSRIVGGMAGPNFGVIWTDLDVWAMDYIEPPLVFGFNALGSNCGLISRHAKATLNSIVYWMSNNKFCMLNGETVRTIPCSVWDFVFQDIDLDSADKFYAGSNSLFGEITFYYASESGGTGEIDSYAKFTPDLGLWDCGRLDRSAWLDQSPVGQPIGGSPDGYLYQHEVSPDAAGQPMDAWFQSGYFVIAEGENLNFVDWIFPDFKFGYYPGLTGAILQITLNYTDYPNGPVKSAGPYSVSSATEYVNTRLRGRFVSVKVESQDLGSFWRLGALKIRSAPDGKR
jgi:hypothetical protein